MTLDFQETQTENANPKTGIDFQPIDFRPASESLATSATPEQNILQQGITTLTSPIFPATGKEYAQGVITKTAVNLPTSFLGALKGFFVDNPIQVAEQYIDSAKQFYKLTNTAGGIVNALDYLAKGMIKNVKEQGFNKTIDEALNRITEQFAPKAAREFSLGLLGSKATNEKGLLFGGISPATEQHFTNAKIALINDPFGQVAPFLFLADAGFKKIGAGDIFEQGMSDIARPIIEGGRKVKRIITAPVRKAIAPFANSYQSELAGKFEQAGIRPPVSAVTSNPFLKSMEGLMSKTPFGQDIYDIYNKAKNSLDAQAETLIKDIKPEMLTDETLGKNIIQANQIWEENYRQTEGKIWQQFSKENGKLPITNEALNSLTSALEQIIADEGKSLYGKPNPKLTTLLDYLRSAQKAHTAFSFDVLKKTQEDIGYDIARFDDPALKRFYGPLREALNTTVSAKDSKLGGELDKMFSDYKTMQELINDSIGRSIQRSSPENVAKNLRSKKGPIFLNSLKLRVGPEIWTEYTNSYLGKIIENSFTRGSFDVDKFAKNLGDINSESARILFDEAQRQRLGDFIDNMRNNKELHDALQSGTKIREGSQTAYTQHTIGLFTAISGFISALVSGHFQIAAAIALGVASEYGVSKLFTTETGRKFLTEGFKPGEVKIPMGLSIKDVSKESESIPKLVSKGDFGNIYEGLKGQEAIDFLLQKKEGEVKNAFSNPEIKDGIDLIWNVDDGKGLQEIAEKHPEVLSKLTDIIKKGKIYSKTSNRIRLISNLTEKGEIAIIRLDFNGKSKQWLLTGFMKD